MKKNEVKIEADAHVRKRKDDAACSSPETATCWRTDGSKTNRFRPLLGARRERDGLWAFLFIGSGKRALFYRRRPSVRVRLGGFLSLSLSSRLPRLLSFHTRMLIISCGRRRAAEPRVPLDPDPGALARTVTDSSRQL